MSVLFHICYRIKSPSKLKLINRDAYKNTKAKAIGKKTFQPKRINWSQRTRGTTPRIIINKKIKKKVFKEKNKGPGIKDNKDVNSNQPPTNKITVIAHIKIMLLYSAKKKRANPIAEYSTLYPETNSASASGKSKGCRFVSANVEIKNKIKVGNSGI